MPQDRDWPLYYSLSALLFGRRESLPHSTRVCLNAHGVSAGRGPKEKTWTSDRAPAVASNCSPPWPNLAKPLQKGAGPRGCPWCRSKRSRSPGSRALQPAAWTQFAWGKHVPLRNARGIFTLPFPSTCSLLTPLSTGGRKTKELRAGVGNA